MFGPRGRRTRLGIGLLLTVAAFLSVDPPQPAGAQGIDLNPDVLRDLGRQVQGQRSGSSILDQSREAGQRQNADGVDGGQPDLTRQFSRIEQDYQDRIGQKEMREEFYRRAVSEDRRREALLARVGQIATATENGEPEQPLAVLQDQLITQFGYDIFNQIALSRLPVTGRLPDGYVLGIGDEIIITFVGSTEGAQAIAVDREGRVVIPDIGPVAAAGRRFDSFRRDVEQRVASTLIGTQVFVSVGQLSQISVYVLGEVQQPGLVQITNQSDALEALAMAGGIKRSGSLRRIIVENQGERRTIDLYELMAGRLPADFPVSDGARVIVPVIGPTAAVSGQVVRPAIYELPPTAAAQRPSVQAGSLLAQAGGTLRPRGYALFRNAVGDSGRQSLTTVADLASDIHPGDILIVNLQRNRVVGEVALEGHVRVPGTRSIDSAVTLRALLEDGDALDRYPYLPLGILETSDAITKARLLKPVNLERILAGAEDVRLADEDRLIVLSASDVEFLSDPHVRRVVAQGRVGDQTCPALDFLAQQVATSDAERFAIVLRTAPTIPDDEPVVARQVEPVDQRVDLPTLAGERERLQRRAQQAALPAPEVPELPCPEIFNDTPSLLPFTIEHAVAANGSVRRPGLYPVAEGATLHSIVAASGGLANNADAERIELLTFDPVAEQGVATMARRFVDLGRQSLRAVDVSPGSSVRFNPRLTEQEPGSIVLTGEFKRPGIYPVSRGEKLSSLIERAGGLTDQAYPFGAVFTRQRVKQEQQESFRRTARELNNALAFAAVKNRLGADALLAAQELAASFATVEAAGRVVVEADPARLTDRPELDTILEAGDTLHIPKRPNFVLLAGDVLNPGALQFIPGKRVRAYLAEAGGMQATADSSRVFVVFPNGVAQPVTVSSWSYANTQIPPGSTLVVPKNVDPLATLQIVRDITSILSQVAISAASLAVIFDND